MNNFITKFKITFLFTFLSVTSLNSLSIVGLASWYGEEFNGKPTANGETFDMTALTAAHKELPFNTVIRVTNLLNNRTVNVRINDRGPFRKDRVVDLSKAAAEKLDFLGIGVAPVKIEVIETDGSSNPVPNLDQSSIGLNDSKKVKQSDKPSKNLSETSSSSTEDALSPDFYIQIGSYKKKDYATRTYDALKNAGVNAVINYHNPFYTVFIPVNADEVKSTVDLIKTSGYNDILIRKTKVPGVKVDF